MENRFIIDTVAFINYHNRFFEEKDQLSPVTRRKIDKCFDRSTFSHKLIIPSVVILEVFRKFLDSEERVAKFNYEIFNLVIENENIEIKPIEQDVLEIFASLNDFKMENHDKLIFASAIQLESILITNDPVIKGYNNKRLLVPQIIF